MSARHNPALIEELTSSFLRRNERPINLLTETILTGSVATITVSSIPADFKHLLLLSSLRTDRADEADAVNVRFNGDTGSNYDDAIWVFSGGSATTTVAVHRAATSMWLLQTSAAAARASTFAPSVLWILNYANTTMEKSSFTDNFRTGNLSADTDLQFSIRTGHWRNTAAITSVTLFPIVGPNFVANSVVALYGVR